LIPSWKRPESFFTAFSPAMITFSVKVAFWAANLISTSPRSSTRSALLESMMPCGMARKSRSRETVSGLPGASETLTAFLPTQCPFSACADT